MAKKKFYFIRKGKGVENKVVKTWNERVCSWVSS